MQKDRSPNHSRAFEVFSISICKEGGSGSLWFQQRLGDGFHGFQGAARFSGMRPRGCHNKPLATDKRQTLFANSYSQRLHLPIKVAALEPQHFGRSADVAHVLPQFAKDVVALVGLACLP